VAPFHETWIEYRIGSRQALGITFDRFIHVTRPQEPVASGNFQEALLIFFDQQESFISSDPALLSVPFDSADCT